MDEDARLVWEYYRRAAEFAGYARQDEPPITDPPIPSSSSSESASSSTPSSSVSSSSSTSRPISTSSSSSLSTVASSVSSTFSSAVLTTDSSGNAITTTVIIAPSDTSTPQQSKSTNTGAIVGGIIGGVAVVALLILGFFLLRRKLRKDQFEANIFDPDRNIERPKHGTTGAGFDLGGGAGAAVRPIDAASNVTPYSYVPPSSGGGAPSTTLNGSSVLGQPEMQQAQPSGGYYPDYNYSHNYPPPAAQYYPQHSIGVGEHFPNPYAPGFNPSAAGAAGVGAAAGLGAANLQRGTTTSTNFTTSSYPPSSPVTHPPTSERTGSPPFPVPSPVNVTGASLAAQNPRSAKEREAFSRQPHFMLSNPTEQTIPARTTPSPTNRPSTAGSPVMVHQDGGRVPEDDEDQVVGEAEIPPTYDSIPREGAPRP